MKKYQIIIGIFFLLIGILGVTYLKEINRDDWKITFQPGSLSKAHSFLANQCTSCHTPLEGVTKAGCVSCHSSNELLLKRQPTAFHAEIKSCKECHREHQGGNVPPLDMDHFALAKLGTNNPHASPLITKLDCMSCHGNQDVHQKRFGSSCISCHSTESWKISQYRHPSPNNRDCVQCHQAPPSHSMGHFEMVSKSVAKKEHADVRQCFLCHRTTSWNDIQDVGWYKHH